jgi:hypothetical protein
LPTKGSRGGKSKQLVSVYFDTDTFDLHKRGVSLRVRRDGRHHLQTIKAEDGTSLSTRGEWERAVRSDTPDLAAAEETPAAKLLAKKRIKRGIRPVFETRVTRTVYPVKLGESVIEVALDQGEIDSGRERSPFCEVELELKQGRPDDLFRLAKTLAEKVPVELGLASRRSAATACCAVTVKAPSRRRRSRYVPIWRSGKPFRPSLTPAWFSWWITCRPCAKVTRKPYTRRASRYAGYVRQCHCLRMSSATNKLRASRTS